jgi:hypothetical protein
MTLAQVQVLAAQLSNEGWEEVEVKGDEITNCFNEVLFMMYTVTTENSDGERRKFINFDRDHTLTIR